MKVEIDPRSELLIERQLRSGRFHTPTEVVAKALEALDQPRSIDAKQAVEDMLAFAGKHQFTLDGLLIQDLVREGRKY